MFKIGDKVKSKISFTIYKNGDIVHQVHSGDTGVVTDIERYGNRVFFIIVRLDAVNITVFTLSNEIELANLKTKDELISEKIKYLENKFESRNRF